MLSLIYHQPETLPIIGLLVLNRRSPPDFPAAHGFANVENSNAFSSFFRKTFCEDIDFEESLDDINY